MGTREPELRKRIGRDHPIIGRGWRLLEDDEVIREGDETERVSLLLSLDAAQDWIPVERSPDWIGVSVRRACYEIGDCDGTERLFRRRVE